MQAFIVEAANRPGEFARHAEAIAKRGINLWPFSLGIGDRGGAAFLAADEAGLRNALNEAGIGYREVPVLTVKLEDKAGTAAKAARKLADAGVNIELFTPVAMTAGSATVAIGVDKIDAAKRALADLVTEWSIQGAKVKATAGASR